MPNHPCSECGRTDWPVHGPCSCPCCRADGVDEEPPHEPSELAYDLYEIAVSKDSISNILERIDHRLTQDKTL